MDNPILTIAIPTIVTRKDSFNLLYYHLLNQVNEFGLKKEVEIISECDNKEISIGAKRQKLYEKARGKNTVQLDDDDWVPNNFLYEAVRACKKGADCVGYLEDCHIGGKRKRSIFSRRFKEWGENIGGFDYVRTPFFKSPILTSICREVGVADMRFGEDHDFAIRVLPFLKTEVFINEIMYIYRHKEEPHNKKYGIK